MNVTFEDKEFRYKNIPALPAARLLLKLQKKASSLLPDILEEQKITKKQDDEEEKNLLDIDISKVISTISSNLDESIIDEIIIPLFEACDLKFVESKTQSRNLDTEEKINFVFSEASDLIVLFDLVKHLMEAQYSDFLQQLLSRFGISKEEPEEKKAAIPLSRKLAE